MCFGYLDEQEEIKFLLFAEYCIPIKMLITFFLQGSVVFTEIQGVVSSDNFCGNLLSPASHEGSNFPGMS